MSLLHDKKKMKKSIVLLGLCFGIFMFSPTYVHAMCAYDPDWPNKPCYDEWPMPSPEQMRKDWQGYYDYKGKVWMETKQAEMMKAIDDGTIIQWVQSGFEPGDYSNYNVWYYYYLNDQVPNYGGEIFPIPNKIDTAYLIVYTILSGGAIFTLVFYLWRRGFLFQWAPLLFVVSITAIAYGFFHMLSPLPFLPSFDLPYPFPHLTGVERTIGGGSGYSISYDSSNGLLVDPYWIVWSMILYAGTILSSIFFSYVAVARIRKK